MLSTPEPAPLFLLLDCSNEACCLGLSAADQLLVEYTFHAPRLHARVIPEALNSLMRDYGAPLAEVAAWVVATGPGSYTGLRIAVSAAKGLATALGKPIVPVNSLEALAASTRHLHPLLGTRIVLAAQDARRDEVFAAVYRAAPWQEQLPAQPVQLSPDSFPEAEPAGLLLCGPGAEKVRQWVPRFSEVRVAPATSTATGLAWLGFRAWQQQLLAETLTLEPQYLKPVYIQQQGG
jgi:tRNA threonylcarbamoyladenosine biosynthesis protein TsaB